MTCWRNMALASLAIAALNAPAAALAASTVSYTYDVFGQLVAVSSTAGRTASYGYDAAGNRTNMTATGTTALNARAGAFKTSTALAQHIQGGAITQVNKAAPAQGPRAR